MRLYDLRQVVLRGALTLCAGVRVKVIDRSEGRPFNLLDNDRQGRLEELSMEPDAPEDFAEHLWRQTFCRVGSCHSDIFKVHCSLLWDARRG